MMCSSIRFVRLILSVGYTLLLLTLLTGCEGIGDMTNYPDTGDYSWEKKGIKGKEKDLDTKQCAARFSELPLSEGLAIFDVCMLRKGYQFNPRPMHPPTWVKDRSWAANPLKDKNLAACANKNPNDPSDTLAIEEIYENLDALKLCMSNKGFTYNRGMSRYANSCLRGRENSIACQSTRSGFTLPPEK